jgi:hypothetical protein
MDAPIMKSYIFHCTKNKKNFNFLWIKRMSGRQLGSVSNDGKLRTFYIFPNYNHSSVRKIMPSNKSEHSNNHQIIYFYFSYFQTYLMLSSLPEIDGVMIFRCFKEVFKVGHTKFCIMQHYFEIDGSFCKCKYHISFSLLLYSLYFIPYAQDTFVQYNLCRIEVAESDPTRETRLIRFDLIWSII